MRTLKYAILGLVNRTPVTGYDITKYFNDTMAKFWQAKHSQIYPELRRLVDEGLVEYRIAIQGEKLEKKLYSITEKGHRELVEWLAMDEPPGPVPKDAFRLRLYFCENLERGVVLEQLQSQIAYRSKRLATLEASAQAFSIPPEKGNWEFGDYLLIQGGLRREQAYIDWLHFCVEELQGTGSDKGNTDSLQQE